VVQEAYSRLVRESLDEIDDVRGWLVVVVTRLCLDQLRSARSRRESYIGPWLPEPVIESDLTDPAERITLDDSVRMAMLVVLERLTPAERATFVLHDVFRFSFDDVATIVGRSVESCRQLATRARRRIRDETGPSRFAVDPAELSRIAGRFITASTNGDLEALMDVLDPNVVGWTDSGGISGAPREPVAGARPVATLFLHFVRHYGVTLAPIPVNGEPGAIATQGGQPVAVLAFETRDGLITRIHSIANPQKLAYLAAVLQQRT
jgi:RNA polymerase sigma-70 factor (ECF subfamily)